MEQNKIVDTIVNRINESGCHVTIPYMEASPVTVIFSGSFNSAAYIMAYPPTLYIMGMDGQVAISSIRNVRKVGDAEYTVEYGDSVNFSDLLIKILE